MPHAMSAHVKPGPSVRAAEAANVMEMVKATQLGHGRKAYKAMGRAVLAP